MFGSDLSMRMLFGVMSREVCRFYTTLAISINIAWTNFINDCSVGFAQTDLFIAIM